MWNQPRLNKKIDDLQRQWELLNEKLSGLNEQWILETRFEERLRLRKSIEETKTQRDQVEEQLKDMENQLGKVGSDAKEVAGRNDDHGPPSVVSFQLKWWLFAALVSACIAAILVYVIIHFIPSLVITTLPITIPPSIDIEAAKIYIPNAQQKLSIMCREFQEIQLKRQNLKIAKNIGDTAIIDAYTKNIQDKEQNIHRLLSGYNDTLVKLANLNRNIVNQGFGNYIKKLAQQDRFDLRPAVDLVKRHYQQYLNNETRVDEDVIRNACP